MAFMQYESKLVPRYKEPKKLIRFNESLLNKNNSLYATNLINVILFSNNQTNYNLSDKINENGLYFISE